MMKQDRGPISIHLIHAGRIAEVLGEDNRQLGSQQCFLLEYY
jgi:hypothetical protein